MPPYLLQAADGWRDLSNSHFHWLGLGGILPTALGLGEVGAATYKYIKYKYPAPADTQAPKAYVYTV